MIFKKIRFKNFFSVGNDFIEIDLQKYKQTVIHGKNGFGKSTLLNAITFCGFGKTIKKVTKSQIVNSINNKNCLTELELEVGADQYLIRRGIKPNIFEIYKNSELLDQSSVGDYQDYLEEHILKCTYRTFCQTSIISIENYKPFMSLTTGERRDFIEDILDIKVFTVMNQLVKTKITKNKDELKLLDVSLKGMKEKIILRKNHITKLEEMLSVGVAELDEKLIKYKTELGLNQAVIDLSHSLSKSLVDERLILKESYKSKNNVALMISDINTQLRVSDTASEFFVKNDDCPTCKQPLDKHHIGTVLEAHRTASDTLKTSRTMLSTELEQYSTYDAKNQDLQRRESEFNSTVSVANSTITRLNRLIADTGNEKLKLQSADNIAEQKSEMKESAKAALVVSNRVTEINSDQDYNTIMLELFKDSGIKSKIVLQYIPVINTLVNKYLEKLE